MSVCSSKRNGANDPPAFYYYSSFGDRMQDFAVRPEVIYRTQQLEQGRGATIGTARAFTPEEIDAPFTVDGKDVFKDYEDKPANTIFRWNLLWLVLLFFAPYPLWLTFLDCSLAYEITVLINALLALNFTYATFLCWRYMWRMIRSFNTPFWKELDPDLRENVTHIVVMPTYKEPVELLVETISSVANQTVASSIVMVVGMEEKTPEQELKKRVIRERFGESFKALVFGVHPYGVKGEIPGACSNRNYAARTAVKYMIDNGLLEVDPVKKEVILDTTTVTVCDADTTFFNKYFENLTWAFLTEPYDSRYKVCWQSPLFYNIALDERWFFTRVLGILRSYFMVGFLIGCDINTMSIYSMSLRLLVESQFFHPGYQMDDIIYTLSAMKATGRRIRIRPLDIPTLSGPTSGVNIIDEFNEWVVQATRWTIGAAEVFHYFFLKLVKGNYFLPGLEYFWWFVYYYGFVLCIAGLIQISTFVIQMYSIYSPSVSVGECKPMQSWFDLPDDFEYDWIFPAFLLYTYVTVFGTAFVMDALVSQILALNERMNPIRNFFHFLSCQVVLWVYCLVEYKAIITIAIYGKKVCGHKASEKHALVGVKKASDDDPKMDMTGSTTKMDMDFTGSTESFSSSFNDDIAVERQFASSASSLTDDIEQGTRVGSSRYNRVLRADEEYGPRMSSSSGRISDLQMSSDRRISSDRHTFTDRHMHSDRRMSSDRHMVDDRGMSSDRHLVDDSRMSSDRHMSSDRRMSSDRKMSSDRRTSSDRHMSSDRRMTTDRMSSDRRMSSMHFPAVDDPRLSPSHPDRRVSSGRYVPVDHDDMDPHMVPSLPDRRSSHIRSFS